MPDPQPVERSAPRPSPARSLPSDLELRRTAARALAACAACAGAATGFFVASVAALPLPLYFPLARRWALSPRPLELSMDYYGRSLYALLGGIAAGLLVYAVARSRLPRPSPASSMPDGSSLDSAARARAGSGLWLALLYALTALLLTAALFAYQLWGRVTFAEAPTPAASTARPGPAPAPAGQAAPPSGEAPPAGSAAEPPAPKPDPDPRPSDE